MMVGRPAARADRRAVTRTAAVAALLVLVAGVSGAAPARALPAAPAAPVPSGIPYRVGYTSADVPQLAAVNADNGTAVPAPTGRTTADEPSARANALVFVTHRPQHVDTDLAYLAPGARSVTALTHDDATDRHPALSPDGRTVAFESDRAGQLDIWVIKVDGTGLRRVTTDPAADTWPTWSPTGDRIAFSSTRDDPAGDIYVVPAAGGPAAQLTSHPGTDIEPVWSPVGDTVAFTTTRFQPAGSTGTDIATVSAVVGTVQRVDAGDQPAWSPDGKRLAYVTRAADPSGDISVRTVASGAVKVLVHERARAETHPTWQGSTLLYTRIGDGRETGAGTDVWSADASGQDRADHTNRPGVDEDGPAFSPDGAHMAYADYQAAGSSRIVVADADGRNLRALTPFAANTFDQDPAWSPDGTMIAFSRDRDFGEGSSSSTILLVRVSDGASLGSVPVPGYLTGDDFQPAWAPDGVHLALTRRARVKQAVPVTPSAIDRQAYPGGSFTIDQVISTPVIPHKPDIVFLVDTTGSMTDTIGVIRDNIRTIVGRVLDQEPAAQFALVGYRSAADDEAHGQPQYQAGYHLAMQMQAIDPAVRDNPLSNALTNFGTGGGNDAQEDWLYPLHRVSTGDIAFRPDSSRIVVLIGDAWSDESRYHLGAPAGAPPPEPEPEGCLPDSESPSVTAELLAAKVQVIAVPVDTKRGEGGLDFCHQATRVADYTDGARLAETDGQRGGDPDAIIGAITDGLKRLKVTVTPTVQACDSGLGVTFDPSGPTKVTGGTPVRYRPTVTVAAGTPIGATLRCTIAYQFTPSGGSLVVPIVVQVANPALPLVTVDDVTVPAAGPGGTMVTFQATAVDAQGHPLTPSCAPPSGSTFPTGQTTVTCTATDASGLVGRDTALVTVVPAEADLKTRIWVVTLAFPAVDKVTVTTQVDVSARVGTPCRARVDDEAPAWSPDGTSLVFDAQDVLCVVNPAGDHARTPVLPPAARPGVARDPVWSPDGTVIAYTWVENDCPPIPVITVAAAACPTISSIWTVPAAGGVPAVLIETPSGAQQPAFLPLSTREPPPGQVTAPGLALTVTAAPQPGYVNGPAIQVTFTAHNPAKYPAYRVQLNIVVPAELSPPLAPKQLGTLAGGATATVTVSLPPSRAVTGLVRGVLTGVYAEEVPSSALAQTAIIVRQPVLRVTPGIGPLGFVTAAQGTDFPPGTTVTLAWNRGISAPNSVVVGADGTFKAQVLVFHHDQLGDRRLVASGTGFGPVDAAFLVVVGNPQPPDFVGRR